MLKLKSKPHTVEAVQYLGKSQFSSFDGWIKKYVNSFLIVKEFEDFIRLQNDADDAAKVFYNNDYVVRNEKGQIYRMSEKELFDTYDLKRQNFITRLFKKLKR